MNRRQKSPHPRPQAPAYREAFARLDEALGKNTQSNNHEQIQLLRLKLFGCAPGTVEIPK
ncbi:MAG: hypothetical protein HZA90_20045 [Verrucomicrobia bacterium]|nr:hypothetical protein [Verrucomicrobiota bacterium]